MEDLVKPDPRKIRWPPKTCLLRYLVTTSFILAYDKPKLPCIPLKGSGPKVGVWSVMRNKLTPGTDNPPTATVSCALRKVSRQLFPITGSTPTPVAKVILVDRPPSTNVEL